jgi:hypothetical protein
MHLDVSEISKEQVNFTNITIQSKSNWFLHLLCKDLWIIYGYLQHSCSVLDNMVELEGATSSMVL